MAVVCLWQIVLLGMTTKAEQPSQEGGKVGGFPRTPGAELSSKKSDHVGLPSTSVFDPYCEHREVFLHFNPYRNKNNK